MSMTRANWSECVMDNSMQSSFDVIVIGAGVFRLSTAMQLAKRGQSVVVLERE